MQKDDSTLRHDWPVWVPIVQTVGVLLFHAGLPFGLSMLSRRYGWSAGHPAGWNLVGLLLLGGGFTIVVWIVALHRTAAPLHGWRLEATPFEPVRYLIVGGPYGYSRNPLYLAYFAIWSGWALFYGSPPVGVGLVVLWVVLAGVIVPYEERGLARQLGEAYRQYQRHVPRWLGKPAATHQD